MYRSVRHVLGLATVVLGLLIGYGVDRLPISADARSITAAIIAWHVGLVLVSSVLLFRSPFAGQNVAPPRSLKEALLTTVAAFIVGALLHAVASWEGLGLSAELLGHRTEGIAIVGFFAGYIQAAVVCGMEY